MSVTFITVSLFGPADGANAQGTTPLATPLTIVPFTNLSSIPILTTPSPAQLSAISKDLASYRTSLKNDISELGSEVSLAVPDEVLPTISELNVSPLDIVNSVLAESGLASTAINLEWLTGSTQGVTTQAWETYLNPTLRSAVDAEATSIYQAEQSIVRQDLQSGASACSGLHGESWLLQAFTGILTIAAFWF